MMAHTKRYFIISTIHGTSQCEKAVLTEELMGYMHYYHIYIIRCELNITFK